MQELKPCPCCGSAIGLYVLQDEKYGEWSVFCDICKTSLHNENRCDTRDDAISAWNRRAERTCEFFYDEKMAEYACSACGELVSGSNPDYEYEVSHLAVLESFEYCPFCGARVIEEES